MNVKIFIQDVCPNCPPARELGATLKTEGVDVTFYDIKKDDGLAEAVYHGIMATPSIMIIDDNGIEQHCWRGIVPSIDEIRKWKE